MPIKGPTMPAGGDFFAEPEGRGANIPAAPAPYADRICRLCSVPLTFVRNIETGKVLPLDVRAAVYLVFADADGKRIAWDVNQFLRIAGAVARRGGDGSIVPLANVQGVYVSHFSTCPKASAF